MGGRSGTRSSTYVVSRDSLPSASSGQSSSSLPIWSTVGDVDLIAAVMSVTIRCFAVVNNCSDTAAWDSDTTPEHVHGIIPAHQTRCHPQAGAIAGTPRTVRFASTSIRDHTSAKRSLKVCQKVVNAGAVEAAGAAAAAVSAIAKPWVPSRYRAPISRTAAAKRSRQYYTTSVHNPRLKCNGLDGGGRQLSAHLSVHAAADCVPCLPHLGCSLQPWVWPLPARRPD